MIRNAENIITFVSRNFIPDVNNSSIVDKYPILPFPPYTFKLGTERFVDI